MYFVLVAEPNKGYYRDLSAHIYTCHSFCHFKEVSFCFSIVLPEQGLKETNLHYFHNKDHCVRAIFSLFS